jgi:AhpD family alkylhydroperoxidase
MAHIKLNEIEEMSPEIQEHLSGLIAKGLEVGDIVRLLSTHEQIFFATDNMGKKYLLEKTELPYSIKQRIAILVSLENSCKMCVGVHKTLAKALGMKDEEIAELDNGIENISCSTEEKELIKFVIRASKKDNYKIVKEDIDKIKSLGYSDKEVLEAVAVGAYFNYINTISNVFGLGE